jgi:type IV secretory pathway component VirB8
MWVKSNAMMVIVSITIIAVTPAKRHAAVMVQWAPAKNVMTVMR